MFIGNLNSTGNLPVGGAASVESVLFDGVNEFFSRNNTSIGYQDFSLDAWINVSSLSTTNTILAWRNNVAAASNRSGFFFDVFTDGRLRLWCAYSNTNVTTSLSTTTLSLDTWYHVGVKKVGTAVTFYINGVSESGGSLVSGTIRYGTSSTYDMIGRYYTGGYYAGYIHRIGMYNGAWLDSDYTTMYNSGCPLDYASYPSSTYLWYPTMNTETFYKQWTDYNGVRSIAGANNIEDSDMVSDKPC